MEQAPHQLLQFRSFFPPEANAEFVYHMERVLEVHTHPYDPLHPKLGMDESPNQLIGETRKPYRDAKGVQREDFEYVRQGVASVFMCVEPHTGEMVVEAKENHNTRDWVMFIYMVVLRYPHALTITFVLDNLSTHKPSASCNFFPPEIAKAMLDRLRFVFTPKHQAGSTWPKSDSISSTKNACPSGCRTSRQCGKTSRFGRSTKPKRESQSNWGFGIDDARRKLARL